VQSLCEFTVILDGQEVFKEAVHVKIKDGRTIVTDVLGESKEFKNCRITEVDVNSTRLVLSSL
jgi:predicted RNA-binding protein